MKSISKAALLALSLVCGSASATMITLETRDIVGSYDNTDMQGAFNTYAAGTPVSLSQVEGLRPGNNLAHRLVVDFDMHYDGAWTFEAGLDAGYGAELFLDGVLVGKRSDNLWWSNNWSNGDVFEVALNNLTAGSHTLELFWAENCCNGPSTVRLIDARTGITSSLSVDAVDAASIPEPTSALLLGLGLMALGRRKLQK